MGGGDLLRKERGNQILAKRSAELLFSILSVVAEKNAKS